MGSGFKYVPGFNTVDETLSVILISLFSMLSAAGAIGGGTLYSSTLIAFGAAAKQALPISKSIIFAGSFVLMIVNIFQHDKANNPKIMWDIVFFLEIVCMLGVQLGAFINDILPEWVLQIFSMIFYVFNFIQMTLKSIKGIKRDRVLLKGKKNITEEDLLKAEKQQIQEQLDKNNNITISQIEQKIDQETQQQQDILDSDRFQQQQEPLLQEFQETQDIKIDASVSKKKCEHLRRVNMLRMTNLIVITIVTTGLAIWRSQVEQCGTTYWIIVGLSFLLGIIAAIINDLSLQRSIKNNDRYIFFGQINNSLMSSFNRFKYSLAGFSAGVIASTLGVGGSIIMTPLMLSMGIPTSVVRFAASTMVSLTSFTSLIDFNETWIFMICVAVFYPIGFFLSQPLMKVCKSTSVIQLIMAICMLVSSIFVAITAVNTIIDMVQSGTVEGFHDICVIN